MRPANAPIFPSVRDALRGFRGVAAASFRPRGATYDPRSHLRRPLVALAGGDEAVIVHFRWVDRQVRVHVLSNGAPSSEVVERAFDTARGLVAVDDDPTPFLESVKAHPVLGPLARRPEADPRLSRTPTVFESLAVAIIEQLVTGFEARASVRRLWQIAGAPVPGTRLVAAPTAAAVGRVPMWKMHEIGVGSRRAATLHRAAGRGESLERLRDVAPEEAVRKLQSLPGIGPWTANVVGRNALGWSDAVPVGDFHAPFWISAALAGVDIPREERGAADRMMLEALEAFRPNRARVALLLEREAVRSRVGPLPKVDRHRREPWRH